MKVFYVVTDSKPQDEKCTFGKIDNQLITEKDRSFRNRTVFIFGPPKMVDTMKSLCIEVGTPLPYIRTEKFLGY